MSSKRYRTLPRDTGLAAETAGPGLDAGLPGSTGPGAYAARGRSASPVHATPPSVFPVADEEPVVRRTADGWRVGDDELPDLTCAMVLADLIAAELPTDIQPAIPPDPPAPAAGARAPSASEPQSAQGARRTGHGSRPRRGEPAVTGDSIAEEAHRLRTTVGQLEHALTARIRIEQAIGVLAERHRIRPRQAFEQLRSAARNRGRRVIDIASDVVASATNPLLQLPEELSRQRTGPRHAKNSRRTLRLE